jgi:hypothetical protein
MKNKITFQFIIILFSFYSGIAQTQFWSDTFEDVGAPSSGARTASTTFNCGGSPSTSYFFRTNSAGISLSSFPYIAFEANKFWAGENIDNGPTCTNLSISPLQTITWSNINISGKLGLSFRGLFAANNAVPNTWEGTSAAADQDRLIIEYRIDGGAWTKIIAFYASTTSNSQTLKLETTGDLIGDGADLTYMFAQYNANIVGIGTLLNLRVSFSANNLGSEELAVDNFRLFESSLSTNEFDMSNLFTIYPNPSKGFLNIKSFFDGEFIIVNQLGQTIKTFNVFGNRDNNINIENIPNGIYFIKGTTEAGEFTKKFHKE